MSFSALGLSRPLLEAIAREQFTNPYPIQEAVIPVVLAGRDVLGIAKTGSGKTAAFVLPILEQLQQKEPRKSRFPDVLILVPTRELALQILDVVRQFSAGLPRRVKPVAVYGGVSANPQMMALHGADIVIATPGRLLDLIGQKALSLEKVTTLVLDEADKMLSMGFGDEMKELFALLPARRQNLLFSATLADEVETIRQTLLADPVVAGIPDEPENLDLIRQSAYAISPERKGPFLRYLIKSKEMKQVLVFVSSTRTADNLVVKLNKNGIQAYAMHGQKSQGARVEALKRFKAGQLTVLVATDLIARGIDIQELPFVINFELPRSPKDYIHRIGRTGRAEATGEAISLVTPEEEHHFKVILKKMKRRVSLQPTEEVNLHGY